MLNYLGFIEHIDAECVRGWVYSPADQDAHLTVVATLDDIDIGTARADVMRKDLAELGFGRGDHAFEIAIAIPIKPEDAEAIEVFVAGGNGERGRLQRLEPAAAPVAATRDPSSGPGLQLGVPPAPPPPRPAMPNPAPPGHAAADHAADNLQIFVLGAARSGTSALFTAISTVFGLPGFGESHVVPAFQRMIHQLRQYVEIFDKNTEDIMIKRMGSAPVEALLYDYVRKLYHETYNGSGFVDKTPTGEAIYGGPLIEAIFPHAYLIATRRTGIEVVESFRHKFRSDFSDACLAWAEAMSGILHARSGCQRLIEIDQFDMANQPERTGRKIATWLGYSEHADALGRFFARERVEKSSTHDWSRRQTLADMDWSAAEKATFTRVCGRMMEAFDYPL